MTKSVSSDAITVKVTLRHSNNHGSIEDYAREAASVLTKYYPGLLTCHVILDHQKHEHDQNKLAEITVHVPQHDLVAREFAPTYEQGINSCIDNLARQLKKLKDKQSNF